MFIRSLIAALLLAASLCSRVIAYDKAKACEHCEWTSCLREVAQYNDWWAAQDCSSFVDQTVTPATRTYTHTSTVTRAATKVVDKTASKVVDVTVTDTEDVAVTLTSLVTATTTEDVAATTTIEATETDTVDVEATTVISETETLTSILTTTDVVTPSDAPAVSPTMAPRHGYDYPIVMHHPSIPPYARGCRDDAQYSSACSCIDVHPKTFTAEAPRTTITVRKTVTPHTVTVTKTDATATYTSTKSTATEILTTTTAEETVTDSTAVETVTTATATVTQTDATVLATVTETTVDVTSTVATTLITVVDTLTLTSTTTSAAPQPTPEFNLLVVEGLGEGDYAWANSAAPSPGFIGLIPQSEVDLLPWDIDASTSFLTYEDQTIYYNPPTASTQGSAFFAYGSAVADGALPAVCSFVPTPTGATSYQLGCDTPPYDRFVIVNGYLGVVTGPVAAAETLGTSELGVQF